MSMSDMPANWVRVHQGFSPALALGCLFKTTSSLPLGYVSKDPDQPVSLVHCSSQGRTGPSPQVLSCE